MMLVPASPLVAFMFAPFAQTALACFPRLTDLMRIMPFMFAVLADLPRLMMMVMILVVILRHRRAGQGQASDDEKCTVEISPVHQRLHGSLWHVSCR